MSHARSEQAIWIHRPSRHHRGRAAVWTAVVASLVAWFVGLSAHAAPAPPVTPVASSSPIKVVATIGMIADVAREIGGDRVRVTGLMGEGVDPHLYKASPGDVRLMADADVVLYNGLHLEGRMADAIVRMAGRRTVVRVTETIDEKLLREPPEFAGHFDPHIWFDVALWTTVSTRIRDALIERDPAYKEAYLAAGANYIKVLGQLDAYARSTIASIPRERRIMVTAHDAFGYFGRAYGLDVLAIQGISTDSEASLQDINKLVDTLVSRKIPAVFIESSVPRKTVDALIEGCKGRGHPVSVGGELFSDAMGKSGTLEGTYVGMVLHNARTVARSLGGAAAEITEGPLSEYLAKQSARAAIPAEKK